MPRAIKWHCVYCGVEVPEEHSACCGEVGHTAPECETCHGTGMVDAPFSESDPCCPDCDGSGIENPETPYHLPEARA